MQWNPQASVSFWLNRAARGLQRLQDKRMRSFGFGMNQIAVFHALQDNTARTQKELAQRAGVEQPSMAEMLARLERDGMVQRSPNPQDGRGSLVSLSRKARLRWPKAKSALVHVEAQVAAGLSAAEKAQFIALLQKLIANLDQAERAPD